MVSGRQEITLIRLLVASRNELKVAKMEISSLYICENIPHNIGAFNEGLIGGSTGKAWFNLTKFYSSFLVEK